MKAIKLTLFSDPSHSWLKVPLKLIDNLSLRDKISSFSYYKNGFVYLEEDCDVSVFFNAISKQYGDVLVSEFKHKVENKWTNSRSKIRSYSHYENIDFDLIEKYREELLNSRNWHKNTQRDIKNATIEYLRFWNDNHYKLVKKF